MAACQAIISGNPKLMYAIMPAINFDSKKVIVILNEIDDCKRLPELLAIFCKRSLLTPYPPKLPEIFELLSNNQATPVYNYANEELIKGKVVVGHNLSIRLIPSAESYINIEFEKLPEKIDSLDREKLENEFGFKLVHYQAKLNGIVGNFSK